MLVLAGTEEIHRLLWKPQILYHVYMILSIYPILNHKTPFTLITLHYSPSFNYEIMKFLKKFPQATAYLLFPGTQADLHILTITFTQWQTGRI
jgi:hypothetical protein